MSSKASINSATGNTTIDMSGSTSGGFTLVGSGGVNQFTGGKGIDIITGAAGDDILVGGQGNDIITGGNDNDSLTGGAGNDTYIFNTNAHSGKFFVGWNANI